MKSLNKGTLISGKGMLLEIQEVINYRYKGEDKVKYTAYERMDSGLMKKTIKYVIKESVIDSKFKVLDWTF